MAKTSLYLSFDGTTEEAFNFYKKVFKTDFASPFMYMRDIPANDKMPPLSEKDKSAVMHVSLPILGGTIIMGSDTMESMGHKLVIGNNAIISLDADTKEEADRLFNELSEGGSDVSPMRQEFWGYWGCCKDKYDIRWMFNVYSQQPQESK